MNLVGQAQQDPDLVKDAGDHEFKQDTIHYSHLTMTVDIRLFFKVLPLAS